MASLDDLHRSVAVTLASKRLGTPVFVRYTVQGLDPGPGTVAKLAQAAGAARGWLGQELKDVYAVGSLQGGQVALTLRFRNGGTALVSYARTQPQGLGADVLVIGNRGAIYHDAGNAQLWDEPAAAPTGRPDAALVALIEQAMRSGKPEEARP